MKNKSQTRTTNEEGERAYAICNSITSLLLSPIPLPNHAGNAKMRDGKIRRSIWTNFY